MNTASSPEWKFRWIPALIFLFSAGGTYLLMSQSITNTSLTLVPYRGERLFIASFVMLFPFLSMPLSIGFLALTLYYVSVRQFIVRISPRPVRRLAVISATWIILSLFITMPVFQTDTVSLIPIGMSTAEIYYRSAAYYTSLVCGAILFLSITLLFLSSASIQAVMDFNTPPFVRVMLWGSRVFHVFNSLACCYIVLATTFLAFTNSGS